MFLVIHSCFDSDIRPPQDFWIRFVSSLYISIYLNTMFSTLDFSIFHSQVASLIDMSILREDIRRPTVRSSPQMQKYDNDAKIDTSSKICEKVQQFGYDSSTHT